MEKIFLSDCNIELTSETKTDWSLLFCSGKIKLSLWMEEKNVITKFSLPGGVCNICTWKLCTFDVNKRSTVVSHMYSAACFAVLAFMSEAVLCCFMCFSDSDENGNGPVAQASSSSAESNSDSETDSEDDSDSDSPTVQKMKKNQVKSKPKVT